MGSTGTNARRIGRRARVPIERVRLSPPRTLAAISGPATQLSEFALVGRAARRLQRPVAFKAAERSEAFLRIFRAGPAYRRRTCARCRGKLPRATLGEYGEQTSLTTSFVPLNKGAQLMPSVYRISVAHVVARAAVTNHAATIPYRSAGPSRSNHAIERLIDLAARQ